MKIVILATEPSGDFLGSQLIRHLKKKRNVEIFGIGGEQMKLVGLQSWVPIEKFNAIGIYEVLIRIFKFYKLIKFIEDKINNCEPQIIITIDSPSFSYRIVKRLQNLRKKTKFIHYVAPTVWAWKSYRAKIFSKLYDKMFTLFDFEPKYFTKFGLDTKFVGHQIFFNKKKKSNSKKYISFLPGSRSVEIKNNMKKLKNVIISSSELFKEFKINILTFQNEKKTFEYFAKSKNIEVVTNIKKKHQIMMNSYVAIAASGSVTLELVNYKVPTIVFYETHWLTKLFIKFLVKVKYASIINIFYNKEIVPEFLFEKFNHHNLITCITNYINKNQLRLNQLRYFKDFSKKMLSNNKNPAALIVEDLDL